jgi:hypothetical protein
MENLNKIRAKALNEFQSKYHGALTSADLQTFVLGLETGLNIIDNFVQNSLIKDQEILFEFKTESGDLQELLEKRLKHRLKEIEIINNLGISKESLTDIKSLLTHEIFAIKSISRRIENMIAEEAEKKFILIQRNFNIRNFIDENFESNPGYYKKVPHRLLMLGCEYLHIDTEFTKDGITRFQGVIITQHGTPVLPGLEIMPFVRNWMLNSSIYNGMYPCYTIWFNKPITQEIVDKYMSDQADIETSKLF